MLQSELCYKGLLKFGCKCRSSVRDDFLRQSVITNDNFKKSVCKFFGVARFLVGDKVSVLCESIGDNKDTVVDCIRYGFLRWW